MSRSVGAFLTVCALLVSVFAGPAVAKSSLPAPQISFTRFDLATDGTPGGAVARSGSTLTLTAAGDEGTWLSPVLTLPFAFDQLVASWNADTPTGTWLTVEMAASGSGRTTKWYTMGIWSRDVEPAAHRTSVSGQGDADGFVAIDTFIRSKKALPLDSYQLRVTLHRSGTTASPTVSLVGAMASADVAKYDIPSAPLFGAQEVANVPTYSQEIHRGEFPVYDGGGEAWCSPTSTEMIVDYWNAGPSDAELAVFPGAGYTDPQVDFAARGTYDWNYQGTGNWPFNAAYAATRVPHGTTRPLSAFVTRLRSLAEAERFIQAGIPLVASINGNLPGFFFKKTSGHLLTIVGFTANGDVISNDPAVPTDADVHKVYGRADFENVWLGGSGGIVYVIWDPSRVSLPAHAPGTPNW